MSTPTTTAQVAVLDLIDTTDVRHVIAVGGGDGAVLAALLLRNPGATGVLFDSAAAVTAAGGVLTAAGVADRVDVEVGDATDAVPPGGDLYLLVDVLRGRSADAAAQVLTRCHAAMAPAARLVLCQPPRAAGWRDVLDRSGFTVTTVDQAASGWAVVSASPRAR